MLVENRKRVTVKDIAKELNISSGTVSKALTRKPGASKKMRAQVYDKAKEMGYEVNRLAQSLARKPINISVIYPAVWGEYYGEIIKGMKTALRSLSDFNVSGKFYQFPNLYADEELFGIIDQIIDEKPAAVILCPASVTDCKECLKKLNENRILVLLVGNDFKESARIACVRVNAHMAGRLAAEMMNHITPENAGIVALIGDKSIREHTEKIEGFRSELEGGRHLVQIFETQDEPEKAEHLTRKILKDMPNIAGIYAATGNSPAICRVIEEQMSSGHTSGIKMIATDLYDEIVPFMKNRIVSAVIFQDPAQQGREAVLQCYNYITDRKIKSSHILIEPRIILRSNLT